MAAAELHDEPTLFGLPPKDEEAVKKIAGRAALQVALQPLAVTKTLHQLGYEPFPLSQGKSLVVVGKNVYFLPNALSYLHQLGTDRGFGILWTGLDSTLVGFVVGAVVAYRFGKYLDKYYPEVGGKPENLDKAEKDLSHEDSVRRAVREAIRSSTVRVVATVAARPFAVVSIRQIAQLIGGEAKYGALPQALATIGREEGPGGLFSGLIPNLIGELILVWGVQALTVAVERGLVAHGFYEKDDEESKQQREAIQKVSHLAIPFVVQGWAYPYQVVSTVFSVVGSGLAVSLLPYSPAFYSWQDTWRYLGPVGRTRGARLFLRQAKGAVRVGVDKQLYASNTHFA